MEFKVNEVLRHYKLGLVTLVEYRENTSLVKYLNTKKNIMIFKEVRTKTLYKNKPTIIKTFTRLWKNSRVLYREKNFRASEEICIKMLNALGVLTLRGVTNVEGLTVDTWKTRCWGLIESMNLLPETKKR